MSSGICFDFHEKLLQQIFFEKYNLDHLFIIKVNYFSQRFLFLSIIIPFVIKMFKNIYHENKLQNWFVSHIENTDCLRLWILIKGGREDWSLLLEGWFGWFQFSKGLLALKFRFTLSQTASHANNLNARNYTVTQTYLKQTSTVDLTPDQNTEKGNFYLPLKLVFMNTLRVLIVMSNFTFTVILKCNVTIYFSFLLLQGFVRNIHVG